MGLFGKSIIVSIGQQNDSKMIMKNKINILLFAGIVIIFMAVAGCQNGKTKPDYTVAQKLEVKTFSDNAVFSRKTSGSGLGLLCGLEAKVDLPIDGPKPLTDSIKRLVTKELYRMFDLDGGYVYTDEELHIPFEKVCKWDGENVFTDFIKYYRPLYEKYATGAGENSLILKLVSQTETFVTYYKEITYCAASCNHEYKYNTFRKTDGLLLEEIISDVNLRKFVKKYPQYENEEDYYVPFIGLSDRGLLYGAYVATGASRGENHIDTIPYNVVRPYLTEEVQALVQDY